MVEGYITAASKNVCIEQKTHRCERERTSPLPLIPYMYMLRASAVRLL